MHARRIEVDTLLPFEPRTDRVIELVDKRAVIEDRRRLRRNERHVDVDTMCAGKGRDEVRPILAVAIAAVHHEVRSTRNDRTVRILLGDIPDILPYIVVYSSHLRPLRICCRNSITNGSKVLRGDRRCLIEERSIERGELCRTCRRDRLGAASQSYLDCGSHAVEGEVVEGLEFRDIFDDEHRHRLLRTFDAVRDRVTWEEEGEVGLHILRMLDLHPELPHRSHIRQIVNREPLGPVVLNLVAIHHLVTDLRHRKLDPPDLRVLHKDVGALGDVVADPVSIEFAPLVASVQIINLGVKRLEDREVRHLR